MPRQELHAEEADSNEMDMGDSHVGVAPTDSIVVLVAMIKSFHQK